ncbi:hypothetical protein B0H11DRAFT_2192522 [Mycena galericulata]|nr:hypothetical protein B0H11DRAFT_2192522 [Mycena galericulata]
MGNAYPMTRCSRSTPHVDSRAAEASMAAARDAGRDTHGGLGAGQDGGRGEGDDTGWKEVARGREARRGETTAGTGETEAGARRERTGWGGDSGHGGDASDTGSGGGNEGREEATACTGAARGRDVGGGSETAGAGETDGEGRGADTQGGHEHGLGERMIPPRPCAAAARAPGANWSTFIVTRSLKRLPSAMITSAFCIARFTYTEPCMPSMSSSHGNFAALSELCEEHGAKGGGVDDRTLCLIDEGKSLEDERGGGAEDARGHILGEIHGHEPGAARGRDFEGLRSCRVAISFTMTFQYNCTRCRRCLPPGRYPRLRLSEPMAEVATCPVDTTRDPSDKASVTTLSRQERK